MPTATRPWKARISRLPSSTFAASTVLENASAALRRGVHRTTKDWISRKAGDSAGDSNEQLETDPDQGKQ